MDEPVRNSRAALLQPPPTVLLNRAPARVPGSESNSRVMATEYLVLVARMARILARASPAATGKPCSKTILYLAARLPRANVAEGEILKLDQGLPLRLSVSGDHDLPARSTSR